MDSSRRKVFISYVEEDGAVARDIATCLENKDYSTWYYQRDCPVGADYFEETFKAVSQCEALLLLISPRSTTTSDQITREIVSAAEACKVFLPVLLDISHEEYLRRKPGWKQALGAATAVRILSHDLKSIIKSIIPALLEGLKAKGIQPDSCAAERVPALLNEEKGPHHTAVEQAPTSPEAAREQVVILYKRNAQPDEQVLRMLESELTAQGYSVFIDRHLRAGMDWAEEIERHVRCADAVIPLLSIFSIGSEMLEEEVRIAHESAQIKGKPLLLPVRVSFEGALPPSLGVILNSIQYLFWDNPGDNMALVAGLIGTLRNAPPGRRGEIEPAGGAVPLDSRFYIERPTDEEFHKAIAGGDGSVLVKGPRQMGKTSLLARGLQRAREAGMKVVVTDFQVLNSEDLKAAASLFQGLGELIADQLELDFSREVIWKDHRSANFNFKLFMKEVVLKHVDGPLLWGMDEVDRLFPCGFANDVFALFRHLFNSRSTEPYGPWKRLTMAIVHATEPHLFIRDLTQSPFNVGTKLQLRDFTIEEVAELNRRYGSPLATSDELQRYYSLIGGNPYLVRRGLEELKKPGMSLETFAAVADHDEGPLGDHLRRLLFALGKDRELQEAVRRVLRGEGSIHQEEFFRLRTAGVLAGDSSNAARPRCQLYAIYLKRQLL